MREFKIGDVVQHFKRELLKPEEKMHNEYLYEILNFAMHTETGEKMVIYKSLTNHMIFARPYDMFMSEVDHDKYPNVKQKYRLELFMHANEAKDTKITELNTIFIPWLSDGVACYEYIKTDSRVTDLMEQGNFYIQQYMTKPLFDKRVPKTIQVDKIWAKVVNISEDGICIKCAGEKGQVLWELLYTNNFQDIYADVALNYQMDTPGQPTVDCIYLIYKSEYESNIL